MLLSNSVESIHPLSNLNRNATLKSHRLLVNDWIFSNTLHRNKIIHKKIFELYLDHEQKSFGKGNKLSKYNQKLEA